MFFWNDSGSFCNTASYFCFLFHILLVLTLQSDLKQSVFSCCDLLQGFVICASAVEAKWVKEKVQMKKYSLSNGFGLAKVIPGQSVSGGNKK